MARTVTVHAQRIVNAIHLGIDKRPHRVRHLRRVQEPSRWASAATAAAIA